MRFFFSRRERLSDEQLRTYDRQGFLLVSDLIDPGVIRRARGVMFREGGAESRHAYSRDSSIIECFSRQVCSVAAQLADDPGPFTAPAAVYIIRVSPEEGPWHWPEPHIDHALEQDAHRAFPPPVRVACLIYLTDVAAHSGATIVWPGSHRELGRLAHSRPRDYEFMWVLNRDIPKIKLAEPMEILARAGDVLFYHYLCAHAGSTNVGTQERLALSHKW